MKTKIEIRNLSVTYGTREVLSDVNLSVYRHEILAIIGPVNSGKSTLLRCINRLIDTNTHAHVTGSIAIEGSNIFGKTTDVHELRTRIGMIFSLPTPLPMSIFDNLAYGPRLHGVTSVSRLKKIAEECLQAASLWDEVKQRLDMSATLLSGGQQQRLCIARALTVRPEIILFDEPCSGLDPISTAKVEATMKKLVKSYTLILVTNTMKQARRVSDRTAFFYNGELVEVGKTRQVFTRPKDSRTRGYIAGKFG